MPPRPPFQPALSFPLFTLRRRRIHIQLPLTLYIRHLTPLWPALAFLSLRPFSLFQTPPLSTPHLCLRPPPSPPPRISYKRRNDK